MPTEFKLRAAISKSLLSIPAAAALFTSFTLHSPL